VTTPRIINFNLNGMPVSATIMPHETVVEVLQHRFDLHGPRESCGQGLCGCCTVYVDSSRRARSSAASARPGSS
jgi:carbon-monoxide dehydrogenase small subunit